MVAQILSLYLDRAEAVNLLDYLDIRIFSTSSNFDSLVHVYFDYSLFYFVYLRKSEHKNKTYA